MTCAGTDDVHVLARLLRSGNAIRTGLQHVRYLRKHKPLTLAVLFGNGVLEAA